MLRAGSGDRQSSEMSCGPNLGSHPFRSITTSSSAALRPRPQARGALEFSCSSRPAALRRLGPGRPRGPCCAPSSLETCWKAGPCQAARGAAQKSQFHLYYVHRARPGYLGLSTGRAGAVAWQQATPQGGAGGVASAPFTEPEGRVRKGAVIPPPVESARVWKRSPRREDGVKMRGRLKKGGKKIRERI